MNSSVFSFKKYEMFNAEIITSGNGGRILLALIKN